MLFVEYVICVMIKSATSFINFNPNKHPNLGKYFGYPECCINEFKKCCINKFRKSEHTKIKIPGNHTGFIPCEKCSLLVIKGEKKISDLITNRYCLREFPNDDYCKLFEYYKINENIKTKIKIIKTTIKILTEPFCHEQILKK